jgi:hypothetical protein
MLKIHLIIDPRDELVSYERLKQMIKSKCFDQWELHLLKKKRKRCKEETATSDY